MTPSTVMFSATASLLMPVPPFQAAACGLSTSSGRIHFTKKDRDLPAN
jgi:hypothetical protein